MRLDTPVWRIIALSVVALPLLASRDEWYRAMEAARLARLAGQMQEARVAYDQALLVTDADKSLVVERATAIGSRASLLHDLQQLAEAEKGYLEAIAIFRQQPPEAVRNHIAPVIISLAALYVESDQPSRALNLGLEELTPTIESRALRANAYGTLASIAFLQKKTEAAESWWKQSLAMSDAEQRHEDVAAVLSNLGLAAGAKGDLPAAADYFQRSVERLEIEVGLEHPSSVKAQANLGQALYRLGQYREASESLRKAHQVALKWYGIENPVTTLLGADYAAALRKSGRKNEAKIILDQISKLPAAVKAALPGRSTVDILNLNRR